MSQNDDTNTVDAREPDFFVKYYSIPGRSTSEMIIKVPGFEGEFDEQKFKKACEESTDILMTVIGTLWRKAGPMKLYSPAAASIQREMNEYAKRCAAAKEGSQG